MKTKLTKEELIEQLKSIEREELEQEENLIYDKYSDKNFFQIWKSYNYRKTLIIIVSLMLIGGLVDHKSIIIYAILFPMMGLVASFSMVFEITSIVYKVKGRKKL